MIKKERAIAFAKYCGKSFAAAFFLMGIGAICILFNLGAALLSYLQGDMKTAATLIYEWTIPIWVGGTLGCLFGITIATRAAARKAKP